MTCYTFPILVGKPKTKPEFQLSVQLKSRLPQTFLQKKKRRFLKSVDGGDILQLYSLPPSLPQRLLYPSGILINTVLIIIPFNQTLTCDSPRGLINGFLILITKRATKVHGRRKEHYRKFDGSCRGSKARKRHFYHFVMKPWLYSTGPLIYMLCLA